MIYPQITQMNADDMLIYYVDGIMPLYIWGQSKNTISGTYYWFILGYFYSDPKYQATTGLDRLFKTIIRRDSGW